MINFASNIWKSIVNIGIDNASSLTQRIRTKSLNVYSFAAIVFSTIVFIFSSNSLPDYFTLSLIISFHFIIIVLNGVRKYAFSQILFNIVSPILTTQTIIFYGVNVDVIFYPITILFAIICYDSPELRRSIIVWNFLCIIVGLIFIHSIGPFYEKDVLFEDQIVVLSFGLLAITLLFVHIVNEFRLGMDKKQTLIKDIVKTKTNLVDKRKDLEQYYRVLSHDLKNQLQSILGFQELLQDEIEKYKSEKSLSILHKSNESAQKLKHTLDNLSSYTKTELINENIEKVNLNHILSQVIQEIKSDPIYEQADILIESNLPIVQSTTSHLRLLFHNLLLNGIQHNVNRIPSVYINTQLKNNQYIITIKDNGLGFLEKDLAHIFQPYAKFSNQTKEKGSGLGLAIVKKIVENYYWNITVKSIEDIGTEFILAIPKEAENSLDTTISNINS